MFFVFFFYFNAVCDLKSLNDFFFLNFFFWKINLKIVFSILNFINNNLLKFSNLSHILPPATLILSTLFHLFLHLLTSVLHSLLWNLSTWSPLECFSRRWRIVRSITLLSENCEPLLYSFLLLAICAHSLVRASMFTRLLRWVFETRLNSAEWRWSALERAGRSRLPAALTY